MRLRLAVLALALAAPAAAEVTLKEVLWYLPSGRHGARRAYEKAEAWPQPPSSKLAAKPRAVVTLLNRGPRPAEGVILRYAVSARLARVEESGPEEGVWSVPFWVEERRVPKLKANQVLQVPIDSLLLGTHLKKLFLVGLWPRDIKIQVMVEPRAHEGLEDRVLESSLPVSWSSWP